MKKILLSVQNNLLSEAIQNALVKKGRFCIENVSPNQDGKILDFVNTVSKYEFDMDMKKGHVVVDAKSLLGIMHLGINNEIALQMYTDDCEELCREIAKYAA